MVIAPWKPGIHFYHLLTAQYLQVRNRFSISLLAPTADLLQEHTVLCKQEIQRHRQCLCGAGWQKLIVKPLCILGENGKVLKQFLILKPFIQLYLKYGLKHNRKKHFQSYCFPLLPSTSNKRQLIYQKNTLIYVEKWTGSNSERARLYFHFIILAFKWVLAWNIYELSELSSRVHFLCVRSVLFLFLRADQPQMLGEEDNSISCTKGSPAMLQIGQQKSKQQQLCQTNRCKIRCAIYVSLICILERFYYFSHFQDLGQLIPKNFKASEKLFLKIGGFLA